jgi:two-component system, OmpR family, alkaline phosphatase synthesis response regulator PhoP
MIDGKEESASHLGKTILVIEDDRSLREGLALNFKLHGYDIITAADGEEGLRKAFDTRPDLIVLDIMLPGYSGLEILTELREHGEDVPVLVLSSLDALDNKVEGLDLGADDYVTKPFELPELLARVEAMLRRRDVNSKAEPPISFGEVVIDVSGREITVGTSRIELSAKEFDLLCLLARSPGRAFTRAEILDRVWGWGFDGSTRTVDNFILVLRRKIEADPAQIRRRKLLFFTGALRPACRKEGGPCPQKPGKDFPSKKCRR